MTIEYALGYHEAWEVWLHVQRADWLTRGVQVTAAQEQQHLENWLSRNLKHAVKATLCPICNERIAECLLTGEDPFAVPQFARDALENFNISLKRRKRG